MTAGQAIEQADELRPNNQFTDSLKQSWLHQCDARMRTSIVQRSRTADFDAVGADVNWNAKDWNTKRCCWHRKPFALCMCTGCVRRWIWRWARQHGP